MSHSVRNILCDPVVIGNPKPRTLYKVFRFGNMSPQRSLRLNDHVNPCVGRFPDRSLNPWRTSPKLSGSTDWASQRGKSRLMSTSLHVQNCDISWILNFHGIATETPCYSVLDNNTVICRPLQSPRTSVSPLRFVSTVDLKHHCWHWKRIYFGTGNRCVTS